MNVIRAVLRRFIERFVPDHYHGRLDDLSPEDQQRVIAHRFRGGM